MHDVESMFIRPHRQTYYLHDLGPSITFVNGKKVTRKDFQVSNNNGYKLNACFYETQAAFEETTVLYLHTHHGSILEGVPLMNSIVPQGYNFCLFDFAGYGNSEGDFVGLGSKEASDIDCVIRYLAQEMGQEQFVLWGRSMGAVSALLYVASDYDGVSQVVVGVYDSPFYSLEELTTELAEKNLGVPTFLLQPLIFYLKRHLSGKIDFSELQLLEKIRKIKIPGFFLASKEDQFIRHRHSQVLYQNYKGIKQLQYIQKDHNLARLQSDIRGGLSFLKRTVQRKSKWLDIVNYNLKLGEKKSSQKNEEETIRQVAN